MYNLEQNTVYMQALLMAYVYFSLYYKWYLSFLPLNFTRICGDICENQIDILDAHR